MSGENYNELRAGQSIGNKFLEAQIGATPRSVIWRVNDGKDKLGNPVKAAVKLTDPSLYPSVQQLVDNMKKTGYSDSKLAMINEEVKLVEVDSNNAKKIQLFDQKPKFAQIGYSVQYNKIYVIMERFDASVSSYPGTPFQFLFDMIRLLEKLHHFYYTSNNISAQDVMFSYVGNTTNTRLYLVDFKNLTYFNEPLMQNLSTQGNTFFSLNIISGGIPTIYDDIESALYIYCLLNKISFPEFHNYNIEGQIILKRELSYLPELMRKSIFYVRELATIRTPMQISNEYVDYVYSEINPLIQNIINSGPLPIITPRIEVIDFKQIKVPPSETALYEKIRSDVIRWQNILPEAIDIFSTKVVEHVLRGEIYDDVTQQQIYRFLEISLQ